MELQPNLAQSLYPTEGDVMRGRSMAMMFAGGLALPLHAAAQQPPAAPPSAGSPDVSRNGRIAFSSDRGGADQVFVTDAAGREAQRVPGSGAGRARWSRDGRTLLVQGTDADSGRVFAMAPAGGERRQVATAPGRGLVLSPDGRRVAFLIGPWTSTRLAVADADGSHVRVIAGGSTTAWNPAWAPDGRRIAYTYGDSTRVLQVHIINVDGTGDHAVTHMTADDGSAQLPAWSPDGRRLAVQVNQLPAHTAHIWIVDLATGQARRLAPHEEHYVDEIPSWFADGRRLAFQSNRTGAMQVWVMNADGTGQRQVTGTHR
jgi:TolB protein